MKKRTCRYCGDEFIPQDPRANRRTHCYKPACIAKRKEELRIMRIHAKRNWRKEDNDKKPIRKEVLKMVYNGRYCQKCGCKLEHNYFFCDDCHELVSHLEEPEPCLCGVW